MSSEGIPKEVQQFLREHISSLDQLEILLLLDRMRVPLGLQEIASALYISPDAAKGRLEAFVTKGVLQRDTQTPPRYSLDPSGAFTRISDQVSSCYKERRVSVINFIFSNPIDTIQSFADAFLIQRKRTDE